jgi:hypothetical protein
MDEAGWATNLAQSIEVIAANEGTALAMAAGHHLATGKIAESLELQTN